ncbi:MAG: hypothetical protein JWO87_2188 [Phycisphaerales bacterium]|nr:hypothetical protein [Phycisphaerales bacterium]
MSNSAKVQNVDVLKGFRLALHAFAEKANVALGEADSELQRVTTWLEHEQTAYWTAQLRKRHEAVLKAKEALRFKQIFKSPTGGRQSTADEEKAVQLAIRRFQEAEVKMANVKKWVRQLQKETHLYKGSVQRFATSVTVDVPNAAAKIERMITALDGYVALRAPEIAPLAEGSESTGMSQAGPAVSEPGAAYKDLRRNTPAGNVREAAPGADPTAKPWSAGELGLGDAERLADLPLDHESIDPAASVVFAADIQTSPRIYLERTAGTFPGDSGWYIGPADGAPAGAYESCSAADILAARPQFAGLLSFPAGTLIVMDAAGIAAVLNARDEDLWPAG